MYVWLHITRHSNLLQMMWIRVGAQISDTVIKGTCNLNVREKKIAHTVYTRDKKSTNICYYAVMMQVLWLRGLIRYPQTCAPTLFKICQIDLLEDMLQDSS